MSISQHCVPSTEMSKPQQAGQSRSLPIVINKVLFIQPFLFIYILPVPGFVTQMEKLISCNRDHTACKSFKTHYLILYRKKMSKLLLLLLLSHFSRVQLCVTPQTSAHQALLPLGFSRQEHWSGLPFPSPMYESEKVKGSRSVVSDSQRPHGLQPTRLLHPWDFPGKRTGVGCHRLLWRKLLFWSNMAKHFEVLFSCTPNLKNLNAIIFNQTQLKM